MNCSGAGRNALIQASMDTFGTIGEMRRVDFQGKTDPLILRESLGIWGIGSSKDEKNITMLKTNYFRYLSEYINTHDAIVLPGIVELLEALSDNDRIILGLLTGNFTESARIKLGRFDLNRFFRFGVYGDDAPFRDDLPPVAKKILTEEFGLDIPYSDMVIIGDTIYDIRCARAVGAVAIAVGTGWAPKDALLSEKPDHFFDDFSDIMPVLTAIMAPPLR